MLNKTSNIIICPTSLKNQWAKEIARFNLGTVLLVSSKKDLPKYTNQNFVIVNYELLNRNKFFLQNNSFEVGILDEIQKIKNDESKTWASINELKSNYLFTLSGTPIQNNVTDLVSVMKILNKDEFSPEWKFYEKFCLLGKTKVLGWNTAKKKELRDQVGKYIINPTILPGTFPMPSKKEIVVNVNLTQVQEGIHDRATESAKMLLSKSYNKPLTFGEKAILNSLLLKARRAITDERLVGGTNKGERLQAVENTIVDYYKKNKKVVVYSEWIDVLKLIGQELSTLGINYVQFDGSLTSKKRGVILDKFINDPTVAVFLSTDSGGLGIDGLQLVSSAMIHVEDLWNPMKMEQRNGRLIRMLQKDSCVDIIRFYSDSEIEIMLAESNNRKYNIIKEIL
jgi:SNF2 family DNA or RNA helicase